MTRTSTSLLCRAASARMSSPTQVTAGFAYWSRPYRQVNAHLCVVISAPRKDPDRLLIVNFTHWEPNKEQSCVMDQTDYSELEQKSCISYRHAMIDSQENLLSGIASGKIRPVKPAPENVLMRIREGAFASLHLPIGYYNLLKNQGLF